jgi:hypothetical protein
MSNQHVWPFLVRSFKQRVQFLHNLRACAWKSGSAAPAVAHAVIRTNVREFRDFRLQGIPPDRGNAEPTVQNNGRTSLSPAIDTQGQLVKSRTERDGFSLLRKSARIRSISEGLVARAHHSGQDNQHKKAKQSPANPALQARGVVIAISFSKKFSSVPAFDAQAMRGY